MGKTMQANELHDRAVQLAKEYLKTEKDLVSILTLMQERGLFIGLGYTGVFNYCLKGLGLSESQSGYFASITRRVKEVPELGVAIATGELSVSKARRIVPVITQATQSEWIQRAKTLTQRELERQVAEQNPRAIKERIRPVSLKRFELKLGIEQQLYDTWHRAVDLVSRKKSKNTSMEETLQYLVDYFLTREDPVKKAERAQSKKPPQNQLPQSKLPQSQLEDVRERHDQSSHNISGRSRNLPASVKHEVYLRDKGKCQSPECENTRFTQVHHLKPFSLGGQNTLDNVLTLCTQHHAMAHAHDGLNYQAWIKKTMLQKQTMVS